MDIKMNTASGMMEFEEQNNDIEGTKRYNKISLDQRLKALWPQAMGTHFFQNGDPMGTQISVKWGPNGDPRQQNGDPRSACLQN